MLFKATNCTLGNTATLYAQNAMLQLNLYGTDITVGKIVFWVKGADGFSPLTLTCTGGKAIGAAKSTATPFYMVVPVVVPAGFEVEVWDNAATPAMICSFATSEAWGFEAGKCLNMPAKEVDAVAPVEWTKSLSLGKETVELIVIETGVDVSGYSEDANHKKLNEEGDLWEVLDANALRIQTPANKINSSLPEMFQNFGSISSVTGLEYIHATTAESMFADCRMLQSLDLSGFNTEQVTDMNSMFAYCGMLQSLDLSGFNTEQVTGMSSMFQNCGSLQSLDLSGFNTEQVTDMNSMFADCGSLQSLDLSGFNTEQVTDMSSMFNGCKGLTSLKLSDNFKVASSKSSMFEMCGVKSGCTVSGVSDDNIKTALETDTGWDWDYMKLL